VPSVKVKGKITKGSGEAAIAPATVIIDLKEADIGDLAKAAADAETPHRGSKGAPSVTLVVKAPGLTEDNAEKVSDALKDVKGVDAKESKANVKKKEIHVKLDDKGGAKCADIKKALADYTKK